MSANHKPRVVDLFAGGGGLSLGLKHAGFDIAAAIENWAPALSVYRANFPDHPAFEMDLGDVPNASQVVAELQPDLIAGGPPCQDFSSAGKRDESLGRADLTVAFAQIVAGVKPQAFLMENVERALTSKAFEQAQHCVRAAGYGICVVVLDAAHCGAPQQRKRAFMIGILGERDGFLDASLFAGLSALPTTLRAYFNGVDRPSLGLEHYYRHPRSYARRAVFSVDEPSPTIRGVNRPVPKGYPGHAGDTAPVTASLRSLSTRERAMVQTFPADFALPGSKTDVEQVIGNAVPVALADYVGRHLLRHMQLMAPGRAIETRQRPKHQLDLLEPVA